MVSVIRQHVKMADLGTVVAEGQWAGLADSSAEPRRLQEGGKELALGTVWGLGFRSSEVPMDDWLSLFPLGFLLPSSKPSRWLSAASSPLPTQPGLAHWLLKAGLQAVTPTLPTDSATTWGLLAPPSLICV